MHTQAELVSRTTAAAAATLCTHVTGYEDPPHNTRPIVCGRPAVFAHTWDWGESGRCCSEHQFVLNQTAEQLNRRVGFTPLDAGIAPAIERDERIQFNAKILTLEDEAVVARKRGAELYQTNTKLAEEGRLLMARNNELGKRLDEAQAHILEVEEREAKLLSERAELVEEVERLRAFLPSDDHG